MLIGEFGIVDTCDKKQVRTKDTSLDVKSKRNGERIKNIPLNAVGIKLVYSLSVSSPN